MVSPSANQATSVCRTSGDPIPIVRVPTPMGITAFASVADKGGVRFTAGAPAPTYRGQVVAAGGLVTDGAFHTLSQPLLSVAAADDGIRSAEVTGINGH